MRKGLFALPVTLAALLLGAGQAAANGPPASQTAGQAASNSQSATSSASSTQNHPTNINAPVSILSNVTNGAVTQGNNSTATSTAVNKNNTDQSSTQDPTGYSGTQTAGQAASNDQAATSSASSTQTHPTNINVPVSVLSTVTNGAVTQNNNSTATSKASNKNDTDQTSTQSQTGGGSGYLGTQAAGQEAQNWQDAHSQASSDQTDPTNINAPVSILSNVTNGPVDQNNNSTATSKASNKNDTDQTSTQSQTGGGSGYLGTQAAGQEAQNWQDAHSQASSDQTDPTNINAPVSILSNVTNGPVDQNNNSTATSKASNKNDTDQSSTQSQTGGGLPWLLGIQAAGQLAQSVQTADSSASSTQSDPTNVNAPVSTLSNVTNGPVDQNNNSTATSKASNKNDTDQSSTQSQTGGGLPWLLGIQAAGQEAQNWQDAHSEATSDQTDPTNVNAPASTLSDVINGAVDQNNNSTATSKARNKNDTDQSSDQSQ